MLIITGSIAYDYIMDFPGEFKDHILPNQLHNINLSFIVNKFEKRRGGTAGNVSYNLGLLQTKNILFSVFGKDFKDYAKSFKRKFTNTSFIKVDKENYTSTGFAMTDKKDNQIWGFFYGASEGIENLKLKNVAKTSDLVLAGPAGAKGTMSFINQCTEMNLDYMFDPGFILTQVSKEDLELGVKNCKYLIGNDYEINLIKERVKNWQEILKQKIVITTLGNKGAVIENKNETINIGVVKVNKVVDPTGAGDAWRAGFLSGIYRNLDLKTCGQMGSVASSFAIERYGTQEHAFKVREFCERYKDAFKEKLML